MSSASERVERSPLPWAADPDERDGMSWNFHIVQASDPDMRVCFMSVTEPHEKAAANAAFIVRACNSYDALVDLAKNLLLAIEEDHSICDASFVPGEHSDTKWFVERARAALKLAGVEG